MVQPTAAEHRSLTASPWLGRHDAPRVRLGCPVQIGLSGVDLQETQPGDPDLICPKEKGALDPMAPPRTAAIREWFRSESESAWIRDFTHFVAQKPRTRRRRGAGSTFAAGLGGTPNEPSVGADLASEVRLGPCRNIQKDLWWTPTSISLIGVARYFQCMR